MERSCHGCRQGSDATRRHKVEVIYFLPSWYFSRNILSANIGSVVDISFLNPNWILTNATISLILFLIGQDNSFIV